MEQIKSSDLLLVNIFLATCVKYGHRPVVFTSIPYRRYQQAKKAEPRVDTGSLKHLVSFRYLLTNDHKTGMKGVAYIPLPVKEEWEWLRIYVKHMHPKRSSDVARKLLFLNSKDHQVTNTSDNLKGIMCRVGASGIKAPTVIRHCIVTLSFDQLEGKEKEERCIVSRTVHWQETLR